jgi:branched-chain amino acid transport system substrate-binding protein
MMPVIRRGRYQNSIGEGGEKNRLREGTCSLLEGKERVMKRISFFSVIALILILGLSLISAMAQEPVVIGSISPLTGTNAVQGSDMKNGEEMAMEEVNAAGGVLGRPLKIMFEDTESRPKGGIDAAHKLVEVNKVPVIVGAYSSGISLPTGEYTNAQKIVQISVASTSPSLREVGPYFFNSIGLDEVMGTELARFAMDDSGAKRFASITVNNPFGIGIEIWTKAHVDSHGGEVVTLVRYDERKPDYRAEIERLFSKKPEAIFFTAYGTESMLILKQAYEMGLTPPKGWWADYITMWVNEVIPETADGIKGLDNGIGFGRYDHYRDAYVKRFGKEPMTSFGAYGYDAVWLVALAMNFANSTQSDDVREALFPVSKIYHGATGDKTFDKDGMQEVDFYVRYITKVVTEAGEKKLTFVPYGE